MSPAVGQPVQYITLCPEVGVRPEPGVCAAVVSEVHNPHCVSLTVFPGTSSNAEIFSAEEIKAGIAHRTSVNRGQVKGYWRPIPDI